MEGKDIIVIVSTAFIIFGFAGLLWIVTNKKEVTEIKDDHNYYDEISNILSILEMPESSRAIKIKLVQTRTQFIAVFYSDSIPFDKYVVNRVNPDMIANVSLYDRSSALTLVKGALQRVCEDNYYLNKNALANPNMKEENPFLYKMIKQLKSEGY